MKNIFQSLKLWALALVFIAANAEAKSLSTRFLHNPMESIILEANNMDSTYNDETNSIMYEFSDGTSFDASVEILLGEMDHIIPSQEYYLDNMVVENTNLMYKTGIMTPIACLFVYSIDEEDGSKHYSLTMDFDNSEKYIITFSEEGMPSNYTEETVEFYNCQLTDSCQSEGWWQFEYEDSIWYVTFSNIENEQFEGYYNEDDLDAEYTFIGRIINDEAQTYDLMTASIEVTFDGQDYMLTGEMMTSNSDDPNELILWHIMMTTADNPVSGMEKVEVSKPATKLIRGNQVIILRGDKEYDVTGSSL